MFKLKKKNKLKLFKRVKNAVANFDEYRAFGEEKVTVAIRYFLKLIFIIAMIITLAFSYKIINQINNIAVAFNEKCPEFKIEDNVLIMNKEENEFIFQDDKGEYKLIVSDEEEMEDIENEGTMIALLKNKVIFSNKINGIEQTMTYEDMAKTYGIDSFSKETIINAVQSNEMMNVYVMIMFLSTLFLYITYLISILLDILILSVIGMLFSKMIHMNFKYKTMFTISVYSMTLPIILLALYSFVNLFTGFDIKYFGIAYDAISYIYIITVILTIKSDLLKEKIEVIKLEKEQEKLREEKDKIKEDSKKEKKETEDKEEEEEKTDIEPKGSKA